MTRPLIVFSHANGFPSGSYRKFFGFLEPHAELLAIDMYGHDPRFPVNDNWGNLVRELLAFLELHAQRPVIGLGHSMGAMVTFMAAHRAPEKFRGVIMLDPPLVNGFPAYLFQAMKWLGRADDVTPAGKSRNRRSCWPSREAAITELGKKKLFAKFDPQCLSDYVHSATEMRNGEFHLRYLVEKELAIFRTTPSNPWRYLRRLDVPGVIITGQQSDVAMLAHVARMHRWHGLQHLVVPGGHLFPLENPAMAAQYVLRQIEQWNQSA